MKRAVSERGKRYRKFLASEFWKRLSAEKKALVPACEDCGRAESLNAHHTFYRERWEDTLLGDLRVLCRTCHRIEHGLPVRIVRPFDTAWRKVERQIIRSGAIPDLPTMDDLRGLAKLAEDDLDDRKVMALMRNVAGMKIIMRSERAWERCLSRRVDHYSRLWAWAKRRYGRLQQEVGYVG